MQDCDPPPLPPSASNAGGWWLLGFALAILAVDYVLYKTGRPSMSQWLKRHVRGHPWRMVFAALGIGALLWHLLFGGPI